MDKLIDGLGRVAENVWAFLLFVIAAGVGMIAHFGHDKDLLVFAGTIATTGAALFQRKPNSP